MSILDNREDYLKNPFFVKHEYSDYTPFYATITICTVLGGILLILNIVFCCCSQHKQYWQDRHTGNRWIQALFTVVPHKTPPLDITELESGRLSYPQVRHEVIQYRDPDSQEATSHGQEYMEMQKRESEI